MMRLLGWLRRAESRVTKEVSGSKGRMVKAMDGRGMDPHELRTLLESVRAGTVTPAQAESALRMPAFEDAGTFAKVDLHRRRAAASPR